jgi:anti-sigma regulatory factor (Ser/Thr protein kinase)
MGSDFNRWLPRSRIRQVKLEIGLPRHLAAGSIARREIQRCYAENLTETVMTDVKLAANELVTNAVVHGIGEIHLSVQSTADHVRIEVIDQGDGFKVPGDATCEKGLAIVDQLAERWGVLAAGSTHVWCHIASRVPVAPSRVPVA